MAWPNHYKFSIMHIQLFVKMKKKSQNLLKWLVVLGFWNILAKSLSCCSFYFLCWIILIILFFLILGLSFFCFDWFFFSIDATNNQSIGRFINDMDYKTKPNCKIRKVIVDGVPRLGVFALKDIAVRSELRYDYGCRDAPWRKHQVIVIMALDFRKSLNSNRKTI